jgi:hypothetical protein
MANTARLTGKYRKLRKCRHCKGLFSLWRVSTGAIVHSVCQDCYYENHKGVSKLGMKYVCSWKKLVGIKTFIN